MNSDKKKKGTWTPMVLIAVGVVTVFILIGMVVVKFILSDDPGKKKRQIQAVTLVKPPPPPKIKEPPPEQKVEKKEEVIEEPEQEPEPEPMEDNPSDEPPPGDQLGVDTEGQAGGDGFGLVGKKGGRSLIGGGGGSGSLLSRYGWYNRLIEDAINSQIKRIMDEKGNLSNVEVKALVEIHLDGVGNIKTFSLRKSSGNAAMDAILKEAVQLAQVDEPPPEGMPRGLKLKINWRG